ncbi:hypothetical protein ACFYTF_04610 [Nocardia thailandica]|uniref:Uncharacterized protein n=1 Tax=Nocardia thailandica TaxID=257275 RepID=A0ABW6PIH2_9NOCA
MTATTATHTQQAPQPNASRTIDHTTECPYPWCVATGLPDEHNSLCEPYTPATMSLAAQQATERGVIYPAAGVGVVWDRTDSAHTPAAIVLHIIGPRDECEADFTLTEAIALRAQLDRAIGIATGLRA